MHIHAERTRIGPLSANDSPLQQPTCEKHTEMSLLQGESRISKPVHAAMAGIGPLAISIMALSQLSVVATMCTAT